MAAATLAGVLLLLWLALRSVRLMAAVLVTLFAGLIMTMAAGLLTVGVFNIISIAFIALFIGLGIDFGIQFAVRYRHERLHTKDSNHALSCTGAALGAPLALAAGATAAGFFSFLPTTYTGVAELGMVAGIGMVIAFLLSITLLPALVKLLKLRDESQEVGFTWMAPADHFVTRNRRAIVIGAGVRSPAVESVATLRDLMNSPMTSPNTIDITAPSLPEADRLTEKIAAIPEVGQTITLSSFIPADQDKKLALIADANNLLGITIAPFEVMEPPTDAQVAAVLTGTAAKLRTAAQSSNEKGGNSAPAQDAHRLAAALDAVVKAGADARARATEALVPGLKTMLDQVVMSLQAQEVTPQSMPPEMRRDWVAPNGTARIQASPKDTSNSPESVLAFTNAVRAVAPGATGAPISIYESGKTIVGAFLQAGVLSFIAIIILLFITLRRVFDVLMTLLPLILTGLLTLATCVVMGQRLNFANIIALPLLLGIGGPMAISPMFIPLDYVPVRDLATVALVAKVPYLLATNPSVPAKNVKEFIALARTQPLNFGSSGNGGTPHLCVELLLNVEGAKATHIPYKSGAQPVIDLMGGQVQAFCGGFTQLLPHIKSGKLRALGSATLRRSELLPDLPTFIEQGYANFEVASWAGINAPAKTPRPIINQLYQGIAKMMAAPDMKAYLQSQGAEPALMDPDEYLAYLKSEIAKWTKVVKEGNIKAD